MSPPPATELGEIAKAVEIVSPTRFRLAGREREAAPAADAVDPASVAAALARAIASELYDHWYPRPSGPPLPGTDFHRLREQVERLSRANRGRGTWQPGWRLRDLEPAGRAAVEKDGLVFELGSDEVRPQQGTLSPGAPCRVRVPCEMRSLQPGFYVALGEADAMPPGRVPWQLRLYWHLRPEAAPAWLGSLTAELDRRGVSFTLKVVSDPVHYRRADAGVLYLEPESYRAARPAVAAAYREVRHGLRAPVPRLTLRLAPGLSLAEGPGGGESFGRHRCALIARGLVAAFARGETTPAARLERVGAAFRTAGLDPRRPHLAPGSSSRYRPLTLATARTQEPTPPEAARPVAADWRLAAARSIGDALCRSAYRRGGHCNWLGSSPGEPEPESGYPMPAVAALHADLYGGTSGVALFLAELFAATGDPEHRQTAIAAQRQALDALRREPALYRPLAFFAGGLGIAWSARRVAARLDDGDLAGRAETLLEALWRRPPRQRGVDVMSGDAGAVLALLRLHEEIGRGELLDAALGLGRDLSRAAQRDGGAWGSGGAAAAGSPPLTGFAHGAAGIGLACLELARATGDGKLRRTAEEAFAYEARRYDPGRRNWPDLRLAATGGTPDGAPGAGWMTAWCHGAAGIALSRLRAIEVDPRSAPAYAAEAAVALATTDARLDALLSEPAADASLCHGIAGLADVLLFGARVLGEEGHRRRAIHAMRLLVRRHAAAGDWPSGETDRSHHPSLFTGTAGVGYLLLRLDDPVRVPTVLLPGS